MKSLLINKIATIVNNHCYEDSALLTGANSAAVFLELIDYEYSDKIYDVIEKSISNLEKENLSYTLCNGISGICWTLEYFRKRGKIEIDSSFLEDIDIILSEVALNETAQGNWDFLHGALGINLYLHERNNDIVISYYTKWLNVIEKISTQTHQGLSWLSYVDTIKKQVHNFGLSHGIPSMNIIQD